MSAEIKSVSALLQNRSAPDLSLPEPGVGEHGVGEHGIGEHGSEESWVQEPAAILAKQKPVSHETPCARKGRGAVSNASGRYEVLRRIDFDDGWNTQSEEEGGSRTHWRVDNARKVITRNNSPDIHFDRSINPYRGCEHGCIYCFARPTHTYLGHSAGLDFERILYAKQDAAALLRQELSKPGYRCEPIAIGVNTDAYQPLEKKLGITRELIKVLAECQHPFYLITKSSLIERDIDLLQPLVARNLLAVSVSLTTLDHTLAAKMEPRAAAPQRRLRTIKTLSDAGIPTRVSISPVIPALNEPEIEHLIAAAAAAGAIAASFIVVRLPHELAQLFPQWLQQHYPERAQRVLNGLRDMRANKLNDAQFGSRMAGNGPRAEIIRMRFKLACKQAGIGTTGRQWSLNNSLFQPPAASASPGNGSVQMPLF